MVRGAAVVIMCTLGAQATAQVRAIVGPDTVSFASGALTLRGIIYRPAGPGSFPTILFNHGSYTSYTKEVEAVGPAYARLGFVFFAPSRRGQWLSVATGQYIVDSLDAVAKSRGAAARDSLLVALMEGPQLADVRAALAFITTKSYVRRDRVIVAGNSFGGIVTVFASANVEGLYAALDFAGAAQTWAGSPQLRAALTDAVTRARIPILFAQAENDYDLSPSRSLSATMTASGKPNVMRIFPPYGTTTAEGHSFGYFGSAIWGPVVATFVQSPPTH
jgi:carboxymethylenebutenolidase